MMIFRDTEAGPQPTSTAGHREPHKRHSRTILVKMVCVKLLNFEVEVVSILDTKSMNSLRKRKSQ